MLAAFIIAVLFLFLLTATPVAFVLAIAGSLGLYLFGGYDFVAVFLKTTPLATVNSYELLAVPMFILMAEVLVISRVADDMFDAISAWVSGGRGGLANATAMTGAMFGAISGSSTASAATLSATSLPAMLRHGYEEKLACGVVAISGTLAMLIPPSIALIVYAILVDQSVAELLVAGIVPGILVTLTIVLTVQYIIWRDPETVPASKRMTLREKLSASRSAWPFFLLFACVTGSIYIGICTPTEAAGLGAFCAVVIAYFRNTLTVANGIQALLGTARTTAMIYLIIVGAHIFSYFLTLTQITQGLVQFVDQAGLPVFVVLSFIILLYLILGAFMDQLAIMILTVPIMLPVVTALGYSPVWFGVLFVVIAEVGMVTPPFGMNVFVVARYTRFPASRVFRGVLPHVIAHILLIIVLAAFPEIIMWLPSTMK